MIKTMTKDEERLMALAVPVLIPHLEKKRENLITLLISEYRSGKRELAPIVGEVAVLNDLIRDLKTKNKTFYAEGEN